MQTAALVFTILAPLILWALCRARPQIRVPVRRALAVILLTFEFSELGDQVLSLSIGEALPMHLCDWVLIATALALWWDWRLGFELGYFWGLAGTFQALITPAIDPHLVWWRLGVFFFAHACIVVGVLHLMLTERLRPTPGSLWRVFLCSELYLVCALTVNALTGANYGFLAHPPAQATLLDHFSKTPWLYVLQINVVALLVFPLQYLPWWIWDSVKKQSGSVAGPQALGPT